MIPTFSFSVANSSAFPPWLFPPHLSIPPQRRNSRTTSILSYPTARSSGTTSFFARPWSMKTVNVGSAPARRSISTAQRFPIFAEMNNGVNPSFPRELTSAPAF
ncbi:unnamed protein product, partial [Ectocarpus fasciculatus]